ncbi:MAG: hypothetical protein HUU35_10295, partial [Armatimonadetes bacterium]|nr:hypothetical protein [Armatimonadota bacterium]
MSEPRRRALAAGVVGLLALLLAAFVADGLGLTYDEPVYAAVGQRHLSWYSRLASGDLSALQPAELERHWGNSGPTPVEADWHPPLGKLWLALCRQLPLPLSPFVQYRLDSVLLFAATAAVLVL